MKFYFAVCVFLLGAIQALAQYKPPNGFVPDEATAIKIAVAIWTPIFGKAKIAKEKPYHATLKGDVWTVEGSLPEGYFGGVAHVEISKEDGRILLLYHGK